MAIVKPKHEDPVWSQPLFIAALWLGAALMIIGLFCVIVSNVAAWSVAILIIGIVLFMGSIAIAASADKPPPPDPHAAAHHSHKNWDAFAREFGTWAFMLLFYAALAATIVAALFQRWLLVTLFLVLSAVSLLMAILIERFVAPNKGL